MSLPSEIEADAKNQSWKGALAELRAKAIVERAEKALQPIQLTQELTVEKSFDDLAGILETTIKKDYEAKVITFCAMLLAQTESDQINIGYQSDSSTGKTYTSTECAEYFPKGEVMKLFNVSKTAFFYDRGTFDKETGIKTIDLEGKILIFLDQPHYSLLETLRPLLSKDDKLIYSKITNKNKSGANSTQNICIKGFFTVIYCSANKTTDEQEQTRLLFLSAESDEDKLRESLTLSCAREADKQGYEDKISIDPQRLWLKDRVTAIRQRGIKHIVVPNAEELILKRFLGDHKHLIPRLQRDLPRVFDFVKASALFNCFNRDVVGVDTIEATEKDIEEGYRLYKRIEEANELGLSPSVFDFWQKIVKPLLSEQGITRKEVASKYLQVYHKTISKESMGRLLDELETRGLISQEPDPVDRRKMLIYDGINSAVSRGTESNSATSGGTAANTPTPASCTTNLDNHLVEGFTN